nr:MAG TPA: foot protein [Caudoviricetes sp.]
MKRLLIALAAVAVVALGACLVKDLAQPVHLSVPACGIEVECEEVFTLRSTRLQAVIDKPGIAAYYGKYILDHAGQEFRGLWNIQPGDQVIFGAVRYRCAVITTGYSDRGIRAKDGQLPDANLYLCSCVPGGEEFEIYIVGLEREQ